MKKKKQNKKTAVVIGLGEFGLHLSLSLTQGGCDVIAVDRDRNRIENIQNFVMKAIVADITQKNALQQIVPAEVDFVVIALGNIESSIITALNLKDNYKTTSVYIKAISEEHERILKLMGIKHIVFPEKDMGQRYATKLISSNLLDYLPFSKDYSVAELAPLKNMKGKSLKQLDFRKKYNLSVIAVKEYVPPRMIITPAADFIIKISDTLVVLGKKEHIEDYNKRVE